ncbi:MAG: mechanosensitive ion channel [Verrucomicrobiota bacterium]|nr:mechanosensitive ion channel [Verrucomicrobiota bacterium]
MSEFLDFFKKIGKILNIDMGSRLWSSIIVIFIFLLIRYLTKKIISKNVKDMSTIYRWNGILTYITAFILITVIGAIWFQNGKSLLSFFGLFSAGLAIAMHDTISNISGWLFIVLRKPFTVGDRIEISTIKGDVIDIRLFQFSVMEVGGDRIGAEQSTGRIVHVPNCKILREDLANYNLGFSYIWDEIPVLITFESNWENAKKILSETVNQFAEHFSEVAAKQIKKTASKYMIIAGKLTPIVYTSVKESGVELTMRFIVHTRKRRNMEEKIWEKVLTEFSKNNDIDLAYPTIRYYREESKNTSLSPRT